MDKILITGGTGYIGSHTAVELINAGFDVIIIDNLSNSKIQALDGIERITGIKPKIYIADLTDQSKVYEILVKEQITGIIHFAAFKAVAESVEKPLEYYYNNLISTLTLIKAIRDLNLNIKFVYSSSCTVYGIPDKLPVTEDMPLKIPPSPYGKTKLFTEYFLMDTAKAYNKIDIISLRYFNPIGAHPSIEIGESPLKTYNLIPNLTQVAIGKKPYLLIYGNDYPTPDGTAIRDYIHVVDLAKAHLLALNRLLNKQNSNNFEAFNLGAGKGFSVLEIVKTFEKVTGKKIPIKFTNRRPGDIPEIYASIELAKKHLNWKPVYSLEDMLKTAWLWEVNKKF